MNSHKNEATETNWFGDLLMQFKPNGINIEGKTPDAMIKSAAWKTFAVSAAASLPPGPFGIASIIPEMLGNTKIQMNLVFSIAKYYGKEEKLDNTITTLIFAHEAGVELGNNFFKKVGPKYVVRALESQALKPIATKISAKIGARITQKLVARWIPFITAPIFGEFSRRMTKVIGEKAIEIFSNDIVFDNSEFNNEPNSYNQPKYEEDDKKENVDNTALLFQEETIKGLITLMQIDGVIQDEEKSFIAVFIENSALSKSKKLEYKNAVRYNQKFTFDVSLFKNSGHEIELLGSLIQLAKRDGEFHQAEKIFIKNIAKTIDISEEDIKELFESIA